MEVEENVEKCRARLSIFWDAEAEGFRRIWAALSKVTTRYYVKMHARPLTSSVSKNQEERSKLVCSRSPHMPKSPKDTVRRIL